MLGRLLEDCPEGWDAALSPDALDALATRAGTPVEEGYWREGSLKVAKSASNHQNK